jgi:hypothetical protein
MKVRILQEVADEQRRYTVGEEVELPDDKAERFIAAELAVGAEDERHQKAVATETARHEAAALADAPERATHPPARKRGG